MSNKISFALLGALALVGFAGGTYVMYATKPEQLPVAQPVNASFVTPTISAAGGRDIATCPDGFLLEYQELAGASGGVICVKMTSPAD